MDIDHATRRIQEATNIPPLSDVMLELLQLVSKLDYHVAALRLRVDDLERDRAAGVA